MLIEFIFCYDVYNRLTMLIVYACWMFTRKLPRANMV